MLLGPDMTYPIGVINGLQGISSPEGDLYAICQSTSADANAPRRLVIADASMEYLNNPLVVLWDGNTGAPRRPLGAKWSPDGTTIAFVDTSASEGIGGDIWTQTAGGASPPKRILAVTTTKTKKSSYYGTEWSPDLEIPGYVPN